MFVEFVCMCVYVSVHVHMFVNLCVCVCVFASSVCKFLDVESIQGRTVDLLHAVVWV